jgi:hypothetical protein
MIYDYNNNKVSLTQKQLLKQDVQSKRQKDLISSSSNPRIENHERILANKNLSL